MVGAGSDYHRQCGTPMKWLTAVRHRSSPIQWIVALITLVVVFGLAACDSGPPPLTAEMPLHLEEHLEAATIVGSEVPSEVPQPVVWSFDEMQPDWKPLPLGQLDVEPTQLAQTDDALRVTLGKSSPGLYKGALGGLYVDLPAWTRDDWAHIEVRARTPDKVREIGLAFNLADKSEADDEDPFPFLSLGELAPVVNDSTVQTYSLRADPSGGPWDGPWLQLIILFLAEEPSSVDILSVTTVPKEAAYAGEAAGVHSEVRNHVYGRALYAHTPGRVEYRVLVPEAGRLDVGLGVLREEPPVTFRVTASSDGGEPEPVLEETYDDRESWGQRSVDLSHLAGKTVDLVLEAESPRPGTVALWAAPTLTGPPALEKPNVIFYIIDGAGAEYMSLYGYNRRTTPNLERLAVEGAVFERAYSNSSWTRPSTASFMTSLQHSVLGGFKGGFNVVPHNALTMAQHMHAGGYQTAVFTANPNAGKLSGLERGVDFHRETWSEFCYLDCENYEESSKYLHEAFWKWRETYPAEPYWVHFQTVDIHNSSRPTVPPFAGTFVSFDEHKTRRDWAIRLVDEAGSTSLYSEAWEKLGISRSFYFSVKQGFYDEGMAHNDYQLGRLVERLKATGEWENTLLIVGSDHSILAAAGLMDLAKQDPLPPRWNKRSLKPHHSPMFRPAVSRIPLLFVWPGHIQGGQRFSGPVVSMIDVLPTILDLVGLPLPEVMQGQSLAPVLLGEGEWEPRPVILDEFRVDPETGELRGLIEVVDGRWGASLEINPDPEEPLEQQRPVPLLLYDLWDSPVALYSVHEEHPDLVEKYTAFLEAQFEAHQALAQYFTPAESTVLTPEQLEMLRSLGYIQ